MDIVKTIFYGALGSLTFGIFHHVITMRQIEANNIKILQEMEKYKNKKNIS